MRGIDWELVETRARFAEYYNQKLKGGYQELEPKRRHYLRQFFARAFGFSLVAAGVIYACAAGKNSLEFLQGDTAENICIAYIGIACYLCWLPFKNYKSETKKLLMDKILAFWGDFGYGEGSGSPISAADVSASGLADGFDNREIDDTFTGIYKGIHVAVSEQKITRTTGSGRHRHTVTLFKGVLIKLDMPKKFSGKTAVRRKKMFGWLRLNPLMALYMAFLLAFLLAMLGMFGYMLADMGDEMALPLWFPVALALPLLLPVALALLAIWLRRRIAGRNGPKIENVYLEDVAFGKEWNVMSTDQIEARYVLTPGFMERMLEVKRRFYGKEIEFSFFGNKVLIAVHTRKDMFETTSLFTPALSYHKVREVIAQFYSVFAAADVLLKKNP